MLWLECTKQAKQNSVINEARFYGLQNKNEASLESLLVRLESLIESLSVKIPTIRDEKIDKANYKTIQNSLNLLHRNFADKISHKGL